MAVRKIEYCVDTSGIQPAVKQFGGIQGEHRATELVFKIDKPLYDSLTAQGVDGAKLIYRFDGYDGQGGCSKSDIKDLTKENVSYLLEERLTRFGGIVKVVLVITLLKNDSTEMELFSFPALLQLKNLPEGTEVGGESHESMSVLAQVAKDSANVASNSAKVAVEAREKTERARAALEGGTVWIFDGGDAEGNVDLDGDGKTDYNVADVKFVTGVDYIIEQGTSGMWSYTKYASGKCEMWGTTYENATTSIQKGGIYRTEDLWVDLPFTVYNCHAFVDCPDGNAWASTAPRNMNTDSLSYVIYHGENMTYDWYTQWYVVGRWNKEMNI